MWPMLLSPRDFLALIGMGEEPRWRWISAALLVLARGRPAEAGVAGYQYRCSTPRPEMQHRTALAPASLAGSRATPVYGRACNRLLQHFQRLADRFRRRGAAVGTWRWLTEAAVAPDGGILTRLPVEWARARLPRRPQHQNPAARLTSFWFQVTVLEW